MKTYEELEREAYIRGDIKLADLYGKIAQIEHDEYEIEYLKDEINQLKFDLAVQLELEDDVKYWRERAIYAEGKLEEIKYRLKEA